MVSRRKIHTVVLDWDGTMVENKWPDMGDWMPGAVEAAKRMHNAGIHLLVFSARLGDFDPFTSMERDKGAVASERLRVRQKLDEAGLTFVDIWTLAGKPGGSVYIDDRAERYHGRPGSWKAMADKVLARLHIEEPHLPKFEQEVSGGG